MDHKDYFTLGNMESKRIVEWKQFKNIKSFKISSYENRGEKLTGHSHYDLLSIINSNLRVMVLTVMGHGVHSHVVTKPRAMYCCGCDLGS